MKVGVRAKMDIDSPASWNDKILQPITEALNSQPWKPKVKIRKSPILEPSHRKETTAPAHKSSATKLKTLLGITDLKIYVC